MSSELRDFENIKSKNLTYQTTPNLYGVPASMNSNIMTVIYNEK